MPCPELSRRTSTARLKFALPLTSNISLADCSLQVSQTKLPLRSAICPPKLEKERGAPFPSSTTGPSEPPVHLKLAEPDAKARSAAPSMPVRPRVYWPSNVPVDQESCIKAETWAMPSLVTVPEPKYFGGETVKSASQLPE